MKRFSEQLHKKSLSVKMTAAEKRELRERVVSYMEYHPLPGKQAAASTKKTPAMPFTESFISVPFSYFARAGAAVAVLMLIVIPALAERTVPGDGLYAIKVRFNEEVRSTLAFSSYEKIEWETERLNRRIAEARLLASEGRLTSEVEAEVAQAVKTHTENAKREIEVLRTENEEDASLATIELASTLEVQAASLKEKKEKVNGEDVDTEENSSTDLLATVVGEVATQEAAVEAGVPGYEKLMARVETNTTRVYELLESLALAEDSAEKQDITRRITDIDRTVEDAIVQKDMSEEAARLLLVDALQRTQKLIVFMSEIQAGQEYEVEDFVPAVLTEDEQREKHADYTKEIRVLISDIEERRKLSDDQGVLDKADVALGELYRLQTELASTTDTVRANGIIEEVRSYGADSLSFLPEIQGVLEETEKPSESESPDESTGTTTTEEAA